MAKRSRRRRFGWIVAAVIVAVALGALKALDARYPWLWAYLVDQLQPQTAHATPGPTHVLFTFVDHFEPHDQATMNRWMETYPEVARHHQDADGRMPQHSWFWYFSYADEVETASYLRQLAELAYRGFGEVELHLHHYSQTEQAFLDTIGDRIRQAQQTGAMITAEAEPKTAFGFIHGLWALDNSRGGKTCGINNELVLLSQLGCYADFTHPSWGPMHPRTVNRLYYATDDPRRPKSYDRGLPLQVGGEAVGDLLIFEGPGVVRWDGLRPRYDHGDVTMTSPPTTERIDDWVRTGIHVEGRPEWVFVKVFTHGAVAADHEAVLGVWRDRMHEHLETAYNDGANYVLHYVTAREAYNIAKAAEAGKNGNPNIYRNFIVAPYMNRLLIASAPYEVVTADVPEVIVRFLVDPGTHVTATLRASELAVGGDAADVTLTPERQGTTVELTVQDDGVVSFDLTPSAVAAGEPRHG